jgi:hypothetical protein
LSTVHSNSARGKTKYGYFDDYGLKMLNIGLKLREKVYILQSPAPAIWPYSSPVSMPKQVSWKYLSTVHSNSARGKTKYGYFDDYGLKMLIIGLKLREKVYI